MLRPYRTWRRGQRTVAPFLTILGILAIFPPAVYPQDARSEVLAAIESLRGTSLSGLTDEEEDMLSEKLDGAWSVYEKHKRVAVKVIHEVLGKESDSFLILDLSMFLLGQDASEKSMARVATYVAKADPHASDHAFFTLISYMASQHCTECLPAILKILELENLDAGIPQHALPVDLVLGMVFTIYQFGDEIIPELVERLDSSECPVRANAAFGIGDLLPPTIPSAVVKMAREDACDFARAKALMSLAIQRYGDLQSVVDGFLARTEGLSTSEKEAVLTAFAIGGIRPSEEELKRFVTDPDPDIAKLAKSLQDDNFAEPELDVTPSRQARKRVLRELRKASRTGFFKDTPDTKVYLSALTPADIPLINEARAKVLRRVSDECLYEWYPLRAVVRVLRERERLAGNRSDTG